MRRIADEGSASLWTLWLAMVTLAGIAFISAAGTRLEAGSRATQLAQEAARAGGQEIDAQAAITSGDIYLNAASAQAAARQWLAQHDEVRGFTVRTSASTVEVQVTVTLATPLSRALGISQVEGTGTATAQVLND